VLKSSLTVMTPNCLGLIFEDLMTWGFMGLII
jgi:hypothetical protein